MVHTQTFQSGILGITGVIKNLLTDSILNEHQPEKQLVFKNKSLQIFRLNHYWWCSNLQQKSSQQGKWQRVKISEIYHKWMLSMWVPFQAFNISINQPFNTSVWGRPHVHLHFIHSKYSTVRISNKLKTAQNQDQNTFIHSIVY